MARYLLDANMLVAGREQNVVRRHQFLRFPSIWYIVNFARSALKDHRMSIAETMERRAQEFLARYPAVREQIGRVIVGHDEIVHGVLTCLFVGGHCLLEGVPGLGKTLLVRTLAKTLDLDFSRIQFTPDLMPADILGTNMVMETPDGRRLFEFQRGPIFTQICLADEINRATPKTQSAMLETMQEGSVTAGGTPLQAQAAVLRHGHAEPHRAGRHLPAARGPARPLLLQAAGGLFRPRATGRDRRPHHAGRERSSRPR